MSTPRLTPSPVITAAFAPLMEHGSLFCKVIGDALMQQLTAYEAGQVTLEACEAEIGQQTASRIARDLAGDSTEIRLAITEELDALRKTATHQLDQLTPAE